MIILIECEQRVNPSLFFSITMQATSKAQNSSDTTCPVCSKVFAFVKGLNSHLKTAQLCRSWGKGKKKEIADNIWEDLSKTAPEVTITTPQDFDDEDMRMDVDWDSDQEMNQDTLQDIMDIWDQEEGHPYHFVEEEVDVDIGQAGPGPSTSRRRQAAQGRILDEQGGEQNVEWSMGAGKVIRMDDRLHQQWKKLFHPQPQEKEDSMRPTPTTATSGSKINPYAPFASELDWRVARWVVKDKIGNKAFDRFLEIPGVCSTCPSRTLLTFNGEY
jgi:hypothetical protein